MRKESEASVCIRESGGEPFQERDFGMCGGRRGTRVVSFAWRGCVTQGIFLQTVSIQHTIMGEEGTLNTLDLTYKNFLN